MEVINLRKIVSYNADTGELTWSGRPEEAGDREAKRWNARYAGRKSLACAAASGHLTGTIGKRHFKAHRVCWALHFGEWPDGEIDHVNGNPADNRIVNLRIATRAQNAKNIKKRRGAISRFRGVSRDGSRWRAMINSDGVRTHIGTFDDELYAAVAYDLFALIFHQEFARTNVSNDRDAITAFIEEYARKEHSVLGAAEGIRVWKEKVAV